MNTLNKQKHRTCFLSPHSDDTFLEAYYIIKERVLPDPYLLCTVFSESNYVDTSKKMLYSGADITKIRKEEDLLFANEFHMQYKAMNELDCLLRHGTVFFDECPLDSKLLDKLYNQLFVLVTNLQIEYVVAPSPYGIKQHYDHRVLYEIANRLGQLKRVSLLWTDDTPYSTMPNNMIKELLWGKTLTPKEIQQKSSKLDEIYPSQTCNYYKEAIKNNNERLFRL